MIEDARVTGPGHPNRYQAAASAAPVRVASGSQARNKIRALMARNTWTMVITQPRVWNTGERHTGTANGSGLFTWAI